MIKKLFRNQAERVKTGSWSLSQDKTSRFFFYLLLLFLPTQFGKHFWPDFSFVYGLRLDYLSPTFYLTDALIIFIFLFSFRKTIKLIRKLQKEKIVLFLLFLLSAFIGVALSKSPLTGVYGILKILELSFLAFYVFENKEVLNKKIIFIVISISLFFESSLSFLQYVNQSSLNGIFYFFGERFFTSQTPGIANTSISGELILRPYATFPHPNVLAGFLITFMLYLFLFFTKFKNSLILLLITLAVGTVSLLLTFSRLSIILWSVYLIILFGTPIVEKYKKQSSNRTIVLCVVSAILFLFIALNVFQNSIYVKRFSETKLTDESFSQRQVLADQSVRMFSKNPLFGVGLNNFYNNLEFTDNKNTLLVQPVHNIYLLVLAQTGLTGFIFFVYLIYKLILIQLKAGLKNKMYPLMLIFTLLIIGFFDHYFLTLQQGQIIFALLVGTLLSRKKS